MLGVELIMSDDHGGLAAARKAVFGGVPWQRYHYHLQVNASAYVPRHMVRTVVAAELRTVFNAPSRVKAERLLPCIVETYVTTAPQLATWLKLNVGDGLTVFAAPAPEQRLLRTTNGLERVNRELKRRTRVVGIFPNIASCLRLESAVAMEISDEWEAGRSSLPNRS